MLQVLHSNWLKKDKGLLAYKLVLLNPLCDSILTFAKTNVRNNFMLIDYFMICTAGVHVEGDARGL